MSVMRAISVTQFGGPSVLKLCNISTPKPSPNQILIQVQATGVNPSDTYVRAGAYAKLPSLPYTPGNDCGGIVSEVGDHVSKFKTGDRVYTVRSDSGTYAEFVLASQDYVFPLHSSLSFQQGAALGSVYFTAYRALVSKCHPVSGETLLVHGASGGVGLAACQLGRALGLRVLGTAGTDEGLKLVQERGRAHQVFNHKQDGYTDKILESTEGKGANIILEMLANVNLDRDMDMVAFQGRIAVIGSRGQIEITPRKLMVKEASLLGMMLPTATEAEYAEMGAMFTSGQELGWVDPVVGPQFPLDAADQAHVEVIEHSQGSQGKVVLNVASKP